MKKPNFKVVFTSILSFGALAVTAISTMAWFRLNQQPLESTINVGSTGLSINQEEIYGYKSIRQSNTSGFLDIDTTSVTKKKINADDSGDTNYDQDEEDYSLDVPATGDGFYLLFKDANNSFKYANATTIKLERYDASNRVGKHNVSLNADDVVRVMRYTNRSHTTVNERIYIGDSSVTGYCAASSGDVTITTSNTSYTVWVDTSKNTFGLEVPSNPASANNGVSSKRIVGNQPIRKNSYTFPSTPESGKQFLYLTKGFNWGLEYVNVHYWGAGSGHETTWPGTTLDWTLWYKNEDGKDVYFTEVPSGTTGVKLSNAGDGGGETGNLDVSTNNAIWMDAYGSGNSGTWLLQTSTFYYYGKGANALSNPKVYTVTGTSNSDMNAGKQETFGGWSDSVSLIDASWTGDSLYSIVIPNPGPGHYRHMIFKDDTHQTVDILNANDQGDKVWIASGTLDGAGHIEGGWHSLAPSDDSYTYYVVDLSDRLGTGTKYAHAWSSTAAKQAANEPLVETSSGSKIYSVSLSEDYDKVIFCNDDYTKRTGADGYSLGSSYDGHYFELDNGENTSVTGRWTVGPARTSSPATTYTYYLYDKENVFGGTAYCHGYDGGDTLYYSTVAFPGVAMTDSRTDSYRVSSTDMSAKMYSVSLSSDYDHIVFSDGSNKTADLEVSAAKDGWVYEMESDRTGSWRQIPKAATYRYYLYDMNNRFSTTHYAYAYNNAGDYYAMPPFAGIAMTADGSRSNLYYVEVSQDYDRIIFSNTSTGDGNQTYAIVIGATYDRCVWVMRDTGFGQWYKDIADLSVSTVDYYVYDKTNVFGNTAPYAYTYLDNNFTGAGGTGTITQSFYTQTENAIWASSPQTEQAMDNSTPIPHLWKISGISSTFTHIIFHNRSTIQTATANSAVESGKPYFVINGASSIIDGHTHYGGSWVASMAAISLSVCYYVKDTSDALHPLNFSPKTVGYDNVAIGGAYSPSYTTPEFYNDPANGICYLFKPEGSGTIWFTNSNCTTSFVNGSTVSSTTALYLRMICDMDDMATIYVDSSCTGYDDGTLWDNTNLYAWQEIGGVRYDNANNGNTNSNFQLSVQVAPKLYRLTLPKTCTFRFNNYSWSGGNNESVDVTDLTSHASNGEILFINRAIGQTKSLYSWGKTIDTNIGTAQVFVNGSSAATMGVGDITDSNYFIFELGINLNENSEVVIKVRDANLTLAPNLSKGTVSDGTRVFDYGDLLDGASGNGATYLSEKAETHEIVIEETGRYNFYMTNEGEIAIAAVPVLGNGFYIMPYVDTTNGFHGATKMTTVSDSEAYYNGWIARPDYDSDDDYEPDCTRIFIRSYVSAVDKLYTALDSSALHNSEATISEGVITLKPGKYNIRIANDTITIRSFVQDDFFSLDPLIQGKSILENYTSLVLEIPFTTTNVLPMTCTLDVGSTLPSYLGIALYVTDQKLALPYEYMREHCFDALEHASSFADDTELNSGSYFAYVLLDYCAGASSLSIPSNPSVAIQFYLRMVQA